VNQKKSDFSSAESMENYSAAHTTMRQYSVGGQRTPPPIMSEAALEIMARAIIKCIHRDQLMKFGEMVFALLVESRFTQQRTSLDISQKKSQEIEREIITATEFLNI